MNVLRLQNTFSWLKSDEEDLKKILWKSLRHRRKGYFHSTLYKQKKWDGYDEFFSHTSGRFLTGLLPEIELAMRYMKRSWTVQDERGATDFLHKNIDSNFLKQWSHISGKDITLYDYQVDYINQIIKDKRGIILSPTGSGKSFTMIGVLKALPPGTPTLVITKSVDLTRQLYNDIAPWGVEGLGKIFGASKKDFKPGVVTVANVDSIHKIETLLPYFKALIVDEVHLMMSKIPKQVYKRMEQANIRVGMSATPFKFGETDICQKYETKGFFGPVVKTGGRILTTQELQDKGVLSSSECTFYPITQPELPYETYMDAVTLGIAESLYFNQIVAKLSKKLTGRTLVLVERVKQGEMLANLIPGSKFVYGKDTAAARQECIELLQKSENCICIVQQKLISAGINVFIHNFINAMGGKADHDIIQRMGRGLRRADDKDGLKYYDFIFQINDYLMDHSYHRLKVLENEGHKIIVKDDISEIML